MEGFNPIVLYSVLLLLPASSQYGGIVYSVITPLCAFSVGGKVNANREAVFGVFLGRGNQRGCGGRRPRVVAAESGSNIFVVRIWFFEWCFLFPCCS